MSVENISAEAQIHPTAIIEDGAKVAAGVKIGPYSVIGSNVEIGENTIVGPHVVITGWTKLAGSAIFFRVPPLVRNRRI